jgi:Protein of unknown function (DUF5661)
MQKDFTFSEHKARAIGEAIGIDWAASRFDLAQFRMGLEVELEHGRRDPATNVSDDDEITTGKIALADLNEFRTITAVSRRWKPSAIGPNVTNPRLGGPQPRSARRALRITARSMTSWNNAPATGGR